MPSPVGSDRTAAGDGNAVLFTAVSRGRSQVLSRSSMKGGQFKISSPAGVVKTWLVLPVASSAPSVGAPDFVVEVQPRAFGFEQARGDGERVGQPGGREKIHFQMDDRNGDVLLDERGIINAEPPAKRAPAFLEIIDVVPVPDDVQRVHLVEADEHGGLFLDERAGRVSPDGAAAGGIVR